MGQKEKREARNAQRKEEQRAKRRLYMENTLIVLICLSVLGWFGYSTGMNFVKENHLDVVEYHLQADGMTDYLNGVLSSLEAGEE